jgi:plasmid stability protein
MTLAEDRSVQIRHVPDDVHRVLRRRAAGEGKSMQEYLLALLVDQARRPTAREVLERAGRHSGGEVDSGDMIRQLRDERDAR